MTYRLIFLYLGYCFCSIANAVDVTVQVKNQHGQYAEYAVVSLTPLAEDYVSTNTDRTAVMDQIDRQYDPFVLIVQQGTEVNFPNWDDIKHQVYSFSAVKRFELKLYSGKDVSPVIFNKPGAVALGCNIHDWMLGYIYVAETEYFSLTDETGLAVIADVPAGEYRISFWHPGLRGDASQHDANIVITESNKLLKKDLRLKKVKVPLARPADVSEY